jgi:hypothetical protein
MPYKVRKSGAKYAIVNKSTGKTVGKSTSKAKAQKSANVRNAVDHGWKPTKGR